MSEDYNPTQGKHQSWNTPENNPRQTSPNQENKRVLTGILAIILGQFGIHKFILGYNQEGAIMLIITLVGYATSCFGIGVLIVSAMSVIGLIEGIIYLTKTDEEFYQTYQTGKRPWF
ncbi:MAG: TM2 domain-containing protein [Flavobacteriaceae bacterium]